MKKALAIAASAVVFLSGLVAGGWSPSADPANALSGAEFDPGNIISDGLFYDSYAMSESEIQSFLTAHGSGLASYSTATASKPRSVSTATGQVRCESYTSAGVESAARIIFKAQQACGISAKVILVTLQKERSLVQKATPSAADLKVAMGFACPDTAACDTNFYGFFNQVYEGAKQLNTYRAARFGIQPGTRDILFHPDAARCGAASVTINNYATAALYNYTPYQPNAAALANLGGTGDSCSSYGNRNFWYFYNVWFGASVSSVGSPVGEIKEMWVETGSINMWGWAIDPSAVTQSTVLHILLDDKWIVWRADQPNGTAAAYYPGAGNNHGFGGRISASPGPHQLCVYAKNVGDGRDLQMTCQTIVVPDGSPSGGLTAVTVAQNRVDIAGWATDRDDVNRAATLHISLGAAWQVAKANQPFTPAGTDIRGVGASTAFSGNYSAPAGPLRVCVYVINEVGPGGTTTLGCRDVVVPGPPAPGTGAVAVKGPGGELLPGSTVEIRRDSCTGPAVWRTTTTSAPNAYGAFGVTLDIGTYCVLPLVAPAGYALTPPSTFVVKSGPGNWHTVWLPKLVDGAVAAKDHSSTPINGVTVAIRTGTCATSGTAVWQQVTSTNRWSTGSFGISLAPGAHCVTALTVPAGYSVPAPVDLTVRSGTPAWATLWVPPA